VARSTVETARPVTETATLLIGCVFDDDEFYIVLEGGSQRVPETRQCLPLLLGGAALLATSLGSSDRLAATAGGLLLGGVVCLLGASFHPERKPVKAL